MTAEPRAAAPHAAEPPAAGRGRGTLRRLLPAVLPHRRTAAHTAAACLVDQAASCSSSPGSPTPSAGR
ncbi:hypothetical protein [Streptomyces sp. SCUT-3]|uniref:hypothetical protein n=1 Tax=Streptomyces sp. SCUT-3 TaxID=2684469 RepID=UPI0031FE2CEB